MNSRPGTIFTNVRMLRIARALIDGEEITARWLMATFGVSWSTAKKDMALAMLYLPCERIVPSRMPRGADVRAHRIRLVRH